MSETVYLKKLRYVKASQDQVYHTEECQHYKKAASEERFREVEKDDVPEDARVCKECAGTDKRHFEQDRGAFEKLTGNNPGELGMTPLGER